MLLGVIPEKLMVDPSQWRQEIHSSPQHSMHDALASQYYKSIIAYHAYMVCVLMDCVSLASHACHWPIQQCLLLC